MRLVYGTFDEVCKRIELDSLNRPSRAGGHILGDGKMIVDFTGTVSEATMRTVDLVQSFWSVLNEFADPFKMLELEIP